MSRARTTVGPISLEKKNQANAVSLRQTALCRGWKDKQPRLHRNKLASRRKIRRENGSYDSGTPCSWPESLSLPKGENMVKHARSFAEVTSCALAVKPNGNRTWNTKAIEPGKDADRHLCDACNHRASMLNTFALPSRVSSREEREANNRSADFARCAHSAISKVDQTFSRVSNHAITSPLALLPLMTCILACPWLGGYLGLKGSNAC